MAKVAIVLGPDFEDVEFEQPRTQLAERGHEVVVVGTSTDEELTGKKGEVTFTPDVAVGDVSARDFDALVVPGGYSPDHLRTDEDVVRFVKAFGDLERPIAAICHAGSLLIEAGLVSGRTMTSWPSIRTDLVNAGAAWVDQEVVVDGRLVTSRNPDDLPAFIDAVDHQLQGAGVSA
ncbi:type 1 glutamine amidotransferase domain-containing protein [Actinomarinicola tropica]|uniref:DJ-1/PfpI/YhbO family deglycase/protease n=1 Tax=Actinomarinicola tropica TaxID=2789776 RepID=A0A5Q2RJS1_9ACTN|nr:type 1 glutamine amidotransferase domain-containing protein [Actinomarinicola tropica]QGG94811.1 DJ-1/PfpI/YhbO family deglycase/protease [Actinomarinicola tropica]